MATDWHVTRQDTMPQVNQAGQLVYNKQVWFRVDTEPGEGHEDFVTVQDTPGYGDKAAALIQAKVGEIKALFTA